LRGLAGGAADYIIKPVDADIVSAKLARHLRKIGTDILIVEDDISVASLLEHRFVAAGFSPRVTGHGAEALNLVRDLPPDLIVLDRNLPDAEGADILKQMRTIPGVADTPVAFLTARSSDADMRDGYAHGAEDYITKPFDADDVVGRCARLLTRSREAA
jgi:two-component system phosphate regulon response regulator PhoB